MANQLGVAIIGCGYWGVNYVRIFSEMQQTRVVTVCDARGQRLQDVSQRFPYLLFTTDMDQVLKLDGVDAVIVATPATTHFDVVRRALQAGKHVLVEKPITKIATESEELTQLAESKGLTLMVAHTFLYNPAVRKMKELIDQGKAGQVYYLYARRTNMGPIRQDVNAIWDLAPHDVCILNYLLDDKPIWASAVGAKVLRNTREDVGFISLGYHNDVIGHIHVSWADAYKVREVVAVGSEARIVFNDTNPLVRLQVFEKGVVAVQPEAASYGEYQFSIRDGDIISPRIDGTEPLRNQCNHFVDCVRHGLRPQTDGWAGRDVVQVMEAIDHSLAGNGSPVEVSTGSLRA